MFIMQIAKSYEQIIQFFFKKKVFFLYKISWNCEKNMVSFPYSGLRTVRIVVYMIVYVPKKGWGLKKILSLFLVIYGISNIINMFSNNLIMGVLRCLEIC